MLSWLDSGDLVGRYMLSRRVGRGAEAEVWKAQPEEAPGLSRTVALKIFSDTRVVDQMPERRFRAALHHGRLVQLFEFGEHEGHPYLALEWLGGGSLESHVRGEPLAPRAVADLGIRLAEGLAHLHGHGLVHRDIKPENVLFAEDGSVKLSDLGLVLPVSELLPGDTSGTAGYRAPEHADGSGVGTSADIWSLGATLYFALTGRHLDLSEAISDSDLGDTVDIALGATPELAKVLRAMLMSDPRLRPGAEEVARTLHAIQPLPGRGLRASISKEPDHVALDEISESPRLGNLQRPAGAFIGRVDEVEQLRTALVAHGGVHSLVGPGGVGKTRLALEVLTGFDVAGGTWRADLSHAEDISDVVAAIAKALSIGLPAAGAEERLQQALELRPPLVLLLDHVDDLLHFLPSTLTAWSRRSPETRFLLTSREEVDLAHVRSMALGVLTPEDQRALFIARSEASGWSGKGVEHIASLLPVLGGLPLAIELAAAQAGSLPLSTIAEDFLAGDATGPPRFSMASTIEQSWARLEDVQQRVLAQLSVFEGGFDLDAAEAVVEDDGETWLIDVLGELVRKSLLVASDHRLDLLAPVRAHAREKLDARVAERDVIETRHARYFARWRERMERSDRVSEDEAALGNEFANLRVAMSRSRARGDLDTWADLVIARWYYDRGAGYLEASSRRLREILAVPELDDQIRAYLMSCLVSDLVHQGFLDEAKETLDQLAALEPIGGIASYQHPHTRAQYLFRSGRIAEAMEQTERALEIGRTLGHGSFTARSLLNYGVLAYAAGRFDDAVEIFEEVVATARQLQDFRVVGTALTNLGGMHWGTGRVEEAGACFRRSLDWAVSIADTRYMSAIRLNLACYSFKVGQADLGWSQAAAALEDARSAGSATEMGTVWTHMAGFALDLGHLDEARDTARRAVAILEPLESKFQLGLALQIRGRVALSTGRPSAAVEDLERAFELVDSAGLRLAQLVCLGHLAEALFSAGEQALADARISQAEHLLAEVDGSLSSEVGDRIRLLRQRVSELAGQ